jgi:hypothetical protein
MLNGHAHQVKLSMSERRADLPQIRIPAKVRWRELRIRWLLPLLCVAAVVVVLSLWPEDPYGSGPGMSGTGLATGPESFAQKQWIVGVKKAPRNTRESAIHPVPDLPAGGEAATNHTPRL